MPSKHLYQFNHGQHCIQYALANDSAESHGERLVTLIFLHGFGDSSDNYADIFNVGALKKYNILIGDHLGHGESQCSKSFTDYSFANNVAVLDQHIAQLSHELNQNFQNIILVGHSMGGDISIRLCASNSTFKNKVIGLVNIEGSLTEHDLFLSKAAYAASQNGEFNAWLEYYITQQAAGFSKTGKYIENIKKADPVALERNAIEFYENYLNAIKDNDEFTHLIGKLFAKLTLPRLFIYGDGTHEKTVSFVKQMNIDVQHIRSDSHWVMFEPEFIPVLQKFIQDVT